MIVLPCFISNGDVTGIWRYLVEICLHLRKIFNSDSFNLVWQKRIARETKRNYGEFVFTRLRPNARVPMMINDSFQDVRAKTYMVIVNPVIDEYSSV